MPGLDSHALDRLDFARALARITTDATTDFIPSPQYAAVYAYAGEELTAGLKQQLASGRFEPQLPIIIDVVKPSGLTRPGAILQPPDRLLYQALADDMAPTIEQQLNRKRVFSNVIAKPSKSPRDMFVARRELYARWINAINKECQKARTRYVLKADVSDCFERIDQHKLVNLLHAAGCRNEFVALLERLLGAWMDKSSRGILQGMWPSDLLGNFFLSGLDAELEIEKARSMRFVDDIYLFYGDLRRARSGLVGLCNKLRKLGLSLNEQKTRIRNPDEVVRDETDLDRLFDDIRDQLRTESATIEDEEDLMFGFMDYGWTTGEVQLTPEQEAAVTVEAVLTLYRQREEQSRRGADRIDSFCLPLLAAFHSTAAVDVAIQSLKTRPHMVDTCASYLAALTDSDPRASQALAAAMTDPAVHCDWQLLWPAAALTRITNCPDRAIGAAVRMLCDGKISPAVRAICAVLVGRHGSAPQRQVLHHHYSDEPSPYVREAIVYASRYFPAPERRTCLRSWGGHSPMNALIAAAIKRLVADG